MCLIRIWLLLCVAVLTLAVPQAIASDTLSGADKRREDLAQFRRAFFEVDRAYSPDSRREAEQQLRQLETSAETIDQTVFELSLARIAALADNAHTFSFDAPRSRRQDRVDMRLVPFGEDFYVLRVKAPNADLLGARLVGIDGLAMSALRPLYRSLAGGTAAWRDRSAAYFLESPPQLRALGVGKPGSPPVYQFITLDGRMVERQFSVSPSGEERVRGNATRWMFPVLAPLEDRAWKTLLDADKAPWALQEPVKRLRYRFDDSINAMIVEMRQSNNSPTEKLADFYEAVRKEIELHKPKHLVLDLRLNGGGDLTTTRDFAESLPTLVPGRLFALTSPWTFSAAISTLGYLKQAAPSRVTIVGEEVGDRLVFFAEGKSVTLTHSKEGFLTATERHDYRDGCRKFDDCHRHVKARPIAVPTLAPDIAAPWTIDAYREGRDPAMQAVATELRR